MTKGSCKTLKNAKVVIMSLAFGDKLSKKFDHN